jgi:hypothetical protein
MIETDLANPFRGAVVQDAWQAPADVSEIHDDVFRACLEGIRSARGGTPDSVLIHGAAGAGKTHLLTRLQRHLALTRDQAPDQALHCVFVFVRLQTSPHLLWQHLRQRFATDVMRRDHELTQLQRMVAHQLSLRRGRSPGTGIQEMTRLRRDRPQDLSLELDEVFSELNLPRDLCVVIEHLVFERSLRDARAWLAGESLPDSVLQTLGLGAELGDDRENLARGVVTALCRLAGETLPVVFCFDQVEALQRTLDDREAFFRFGQMAADLHDSDRNVCLITCLQSVVVNAFQQSVRESDLARMAKRLVPLEPLAPIQTQKLVLSRICPVEELEEARRAHPKQPFFPLSTAFVERVAREMPCVPRRVLNACANEFERIHSGAPAPAAKDEEFLKRELATRTQTAERDSKGGDTTRIVRKGLELLAGLQGAKLSADPTARADLVIEGKQRTAVSVRNEADGRSLGPKLRLLLQDCPRQDGARLVIVRDPQLTLPKTAARVRTDLAALTQKGAILVHPSLEALAALEALASLLGDAKSGDLALAGETVGESRVVEWLREQGRSTVAEPALALFDEITGTELNTAPLGAANSAAAENAQRTGVAPTAHAPAALSQFNAEQDLAELLAREHVVLLDEASKALQHPAEVLQAIVLQSSDRFLLLAGPPPLLLDIAGTSMQGGT